MLRIVERELELAKREVRHGRTQRTMALLTAFAAILGGGEAYSQHVRGAFEDWLMWTPVLLTPVVVFASIAAVFNRMAAQTLLPLASFAVILDGILGFFLHLRGIHRMPGGFRAGLYNVVMGPPVLAPLLLGTVGFFGLLAAALRREK